MGTLFNMIVTYAFFTLGWVLTGSLRSTFDFAPLFFQLASFVFLIYTIPGLLFTIIFLGSCNCLCKLENHGIDVNDMNESFEVFGPSPYANKRNYFLEDKNEDRTKQFGEGSKTNE